MYEQQTVIVMSACMVTSIKHHECPSISTPLENCPGVFTMRTNELERWKTKTACFLFGGKPW